MYNNVLGFEQWIEEIDNLELLKWDKFPDLDLYMDQVISYMDKQVSVFKVTENEKIITPSMINNYIKGGVVPKTVKKKYSKEHIAILCIVCMLKQILPIQDLHSLLKMLDVDNNIESIYHEFCQMQEETFESMKDELSENPAAADDATKYELCLMAMRLAVGANAARIASQKIISLIAPKEEAEKEKNKKEKEKNKEKEQEKNKE